MGIIEFSESSKSVTNANKGKKVMKVVEKILNKRKVRTPDVDNQRFRLLAEAIPQIVWTADPDGFQDYFNNRWFEYTGITPKETQLEIRSAVHPEDQERYKQTWAEAVQSGETYDVEYRFRRASDGMYRWHLGRALPLRDAHGSIVKWFGTCTDIHDQKEEQKKVLEEHERINLLRLQNIIDTMPVGAAITDEHLNILHVNNRLFQLFDLPNKPENFMGKPASRLITVAFEKVVDPELYTERLQTTLREKKPRLGVEVRLNTGRTLVRDYFPVFVGGISKGHVLLYRDVTQEKRIDSAKSEFMSLASHQLRTPLTTIRWIFGRLQRHRNTGSRENVEKLLVEGKNAAALMSDTINTMLAISRVEAGKIDLKLTDIELYPFLEEVQRLCQKDCELRQQSFAIACAHDIVLKSDRKFLKEILLSLISNANKYTPEGGSIDVIVENAKDGVAISVRDSGYGIPAHQHSRVFSKFFRGDNITERDTDGTGLGLYLVSLLVTLLRGSIEFSSEENRGTTFRLKFPR